MSDKWLPMTVDEFRRAGARSTAREDAIQKLHSESPLTIQELGEIAETLRPEELVEPYEPQKNMLTDRFPRGIHYDFMEAERNKIIEAGPQRPIPDHLPDRIWLDNKDVLWEIHSRRAHDKPDPGSAKCVEYARVEKGVVSTVPEAFAVLKAAIHDDFGYAWSWQCNLAMAIYDTIERPLDRIRWHQECNEAAARFMKLCFDVDTSQEAADRHHTKKEV